MALSDQTIGKPLYTAIAIDWETKQKTIMSYGLNGPILTTDLDGLKAYLRTQQRFAPARTYYYASRLEIKIPSESATRATIEKAENKVINGKSTAIPVFTAMHLDGNETNTIDTVTFPFIAKKGA